MYDTPDLSQSFNPQPKPIAKAKKEPAPINKIVRKESLTSKQTNN